MKPQEALGEADPGLAPKNAHSVTARFAGRPARTLRLVNRFATALVGLLMLLGISFIAFFPTGVTREDPLQQNLELRMRPPGWEARSAAGHPLGTDNLGRDVLARIVHGAKVSLQVGLAATLLSTLLGTLLGLIAGYYGSWVDDLISRVGDIQLAFPFVLLAIAVVAVLGSSTLNLILVMGIANWVTYARTVRGSVLSVREKEFIEAARALGNRDLVIILRHVLPNVLAPIIVIASLSMGNIVITESSLSFLGLGVQPPTPSWGRMLSEGRAYLTSAWWVATFPGLAIVLTVVAANLVGDGLRDVLDPRLNVDI